MDTATETGDDPAAILAEATRIADGLHFAARIPDKVPDFSSCGGPAAEEYWAYFTPARIYSLLAAVDAALKQHESKVPLRILAEYGSDEAERYRYCSSCAKHPAWPCPEVRAVTAALTGEEASDG